MKKLNFVFGDFVGVSSPTRGLVVTTIILNCILGLAYVLVAGTWVGRFPQQPFSASALIVFFTAAAMNSGRTVADAHRMLDHAE